MIKTNVLVGTALRDLAQLGDRVKDYPRTTRGLAIRILDTKKEVLRQKLHDRMVEELRAIGGGFAKGSKVERALVVVPGGFGRGTSSLEVKVMGDHEAMIANAWNKGATITPKKVKYLAQPLSEKNRLGNVSPRSYSDSEYSTWFYEKPAKVKSHDNVDMDVAGILVVRSRRTYVMGKKRNEKTGKLEDAAVPEVAARYLMLKRQVIRPTRWAFKAFNSFRNIDFPKVAEQMIVELANTK
jgi:hypothetical protein